MRPQVMILALLLGGLACQSPAAPREPERPPLRARPVTLHLCHVIRTVEDRDDHGHHLDGFTEWRCKDGSMFRVYMDGHRIPVNS